MRIYDALTGKLVKVFTSLNDEMINLEFTNFCTGSRERKMILSDNLGLCRIVNVNNGELIQKIVKMKDLKIRAKDIESRKKSYVSVQINEQTGDIQGDLSGEREDGDYNLLRLDHPPLSIIRRRRGRTPSRAKRRASGVGGLLRSLQP